MKHALRSETFVPQTDPMLVRELAVQHKVLPLVCEAIPTVPPVMKKQAMLQLVHQTQMSRTALDVYDYLCGLGAHPLILKGILCRSLYPQPDHRISGDEDFYVPEKEFDLCCRWLEEYGLHPWDDRKVSWSDSAGTVHIELQKFLFDQNQLKKYPLEQLFSDGFAQTASYEPEPGRWVRSFDPHLHFLYLILHAYKHFLYSGFGLRQICDIGLWAKTYGDRIDWDRLYQECRSVRAVHFTAAVFQIVGDVLGIRFSPQGRWNTVSVDPEPLLLDVLDAGIYGSATSDRVHSAVALGKGHVLRTLFPERSYMDAKYPRSDGKKIPLPVLWTRRLGEYAIGVLKKQEDPAASAAVVTQRRKLLRYYKIQ